MVTSVACLRRYCGTSEAPPSLKHGQQHVSTAPPRRPGSAGHRYPFEKGHSRPHRSGDLLTLATSKRYAAVLPAESEFPSTTSSICFCILLDPTTGPLCCRRSRLSPAA